MKTESAHPPALYLTFSDDGAHIRKWSREPFDGAGEYVRAPVCAKPHLEFRPDDKGRFDEIVARFGDGMVHVETMSKRSCYVGFYWDDGRYCQWWISSAGKLAYHHEDGISPPPCYNSQGDEQVPTRPTTAGGE